MMLRRINSFRARCLLCALSASLAIAVSSSADVVYTVSLPAPQTQMVDISVVFSDVEEAELDVMLPVWRPGRYEMLYPAETVRSVRAVDAQGESLPIRKVDPSTWRIKSHGSSTVRISYRIYANSIENRTRHVDDSHAFLSGSSVFMYNPARRSQPVEVHIDAPEDWKIATGLEYAPGRTDVLVADDYDVLVDSPIEIGRHERFTFEVDGVGYEIVIWGEGTYDEDQLVTDFRKIVVDQVAMFGRMPYDRYVFLIHVFPGGGGGTEHLNSTIMQTRRTTFEDDRAYERFLGLVAHEFYHTWNVKQFRPACIHPYDYQRENVCELFWVVEGTTSYYDDLTLVRTDLIKLSRYFDIIAGSFARLSESPGRLEQSLEESSFDAWIKYNRHSPDDINSEISFYSKGALVSLLLDMEIRRLTHNQTTLKDVMRIMFERFPLSGDGYTTSDFRAVVEELTQQDFGAFFEQYVAGVQELPLADALEVVGLRLFFDADDSDEGESVDAYLGMVLTGGDRPTVRSVRSDGPAYDAGLIAGDEIVAMNGRRLGGGDLNKRLEDMQPGDRVQFTLFRRDELRTVTVALDERPAGEWTIERVEQPTDAQRAAYASWLNRDWPEDEDDGADDAADETHSDDVSE